MTLPINIEFTHSYKKKRFFIVSSLEFREISLQFFLKTKCLLLYFDLKINPIPALSWIWRVNMYQVLLHSIACVTWWPLKMRRNCFLWQQQEEKKSEWEGGDKPMAVKLRPLNAVLRKGKTPTHSLLLKWCKCKLNSPSLELAENSGSNK